MHTSDSLLTSANQVKNNHDHSDTSPKILNLFEHAYLRKCAKLDRGKNNVSKR